ncbi:hypothetical protein M404DRAFT_34364 [Pisolithus tinctorius Marx 270]|uniref:Uncharacterized protein n=1 Tax=Pisolithus tinctorius Marx 270 TaxID=870435 RepID=A0A0C3IDP5_PISTI|nr:hypothetical protein M404DRAFT_34364 [Pisolithus tinctorius Marx 270]
MTLPEDGIPAEIEVMIQYEDSEEATLWEREGYTMNKFIVDDAEMEDLNDDPAMEVDREETADQNEREGDLVRKDAGDIMPLHVLGVADLKQTKVSSSELMAQALVNFNDNSIEGGYVM